MKILRRLAPLALAVMTMPAFATPLYFHIKTSDGNYKAYDLEKIDRLTFANGNMTIEKDGTPLETIKRTELAHIEVSDSESAVSTLAAEHSDWYKMQGKTVVLTAGAGFQAYNLGGIMLLDIPEAKAGQSVDLSELPAGIYVISNGNESAKIELR